jgi:hypothetical protein
MGDIGRGPRIVDWMLGRAAQAMSAVCGLRVDYRRALMQILWPRFSTTSLGAGLSISTTDRNRYANLWEGRCPCMPALGHAPFWERADDFHTYRTLPERPDKQSVESCVAKTFWRLAAHTASLIDIMLDTNVMV